MDFGEFKNTIYTRWQLHILSVCWWGTLVIAAFEFVVFLLFYHTSFLTVAVGPYLLKRFIFPSGINLIAVFACTLALQSNRFTVSQKNLAASLTAFVICSVVSIFHNYFKFLLVMNGLPIVVCAIFADKKLVRKILYLCLVSFLISSIVMWNDDTCPPLVDYGTTIICALSFIIFVYTVSSSIVYSQSEQIDFIFSASQRQGELIQELKIEPLTKLYNRTALTGALRSFVRKFNVGMIKPHLVLLDLDHFKTVNDTYGHANGDTVLIEAALIIKKNMGGIRRAFRYGGEEFVLLFENDDTNQVIQVVDNIRKDLAEKKFDFAPELSITLSAGIAKLQKNQDDVTWFSCADSAMYKAKENGRNRVEIDTQSLADTIREFEKLAD